MYKGVWRGMEVAVKMMKASYSSAAARQEFANETGKN